MTQDEIIRMAEEAGLAFGSEEYPDIWQTYMYVGRDEIERFAALVAASRDAWWIEQMQGEEDRVRADEREACAKVCAEGWKEGIGAKHQGDVFAVAIRARSDK